MPPLQQKRNVFENQQTPICRLPRGAHGRIVNYLFNAPGFFAGNWENSLFTILMLCDTMYLVEDGVSATSPRDFRQSYRRFVLRGLCVG